MKPFTQFKRLIAGVTVVFISALLCPSSLLATGPRVTQSLFVASENEVFAAEQPPFISSITVAEGLVTHIADTALKAGGDDVVITALPLRSVVKYHLFQEQAIAALGSRISYTDIEKEGLIFVPVLVSMAHYIYYQPMQKTALNWDGHLKSLSDLRYGALKGEDANAYTKAGVEVIFGSDRSLIKKLKSGAIDFIKLTPMAEDWLLNKHASNEKGNFVRMNRAANEVVFYMAFNKHHSNGEAIALKAKNELMKMVDDGRYVKILNEHSNKSKDAKVYVQLLKRYLGK